MFSLVWSVWEPSQGCSGKVVKKIKEKLAYVSDDAMNHSCLKNILLFI